MNVTINDSKDAGVRISITYPFNLPAGPVQKESGPWRITMEHRIFNQVVILL